MFPEDEDYCRLCLQSGTLFVHIGNYEIYMLKQCVPDIVIDITKKPMKMCRQCSTHLSDFYRIQRVWQKMQKKLLSHFINSATKVSYQKQRFKRFHKQPVNTCKNKMYCRRNGTFELYKQIEQVTLYPTPPFKANVDLPESISFDLIPDDDYCLLPSCESAKLVEGILMVPKKDFRQENVEKMHLVLKMPENRDDVVGEIGHAIVFFFGCSRQLYYRIDVQTESLASIPEFGDDLSGDQEMAPLDVACAVNSEPTEPCAVRTQSPHSSSTLSIPDFSEDFGIDQEMAPPDEACSVNTETSVTCAITTNDSPSTEQEMAPPYDKFLSDIPEITDEPEDIPDYISVTRLRQREDGKIVMMNQEETIVGQVITYPDCDPKPPLKKIRKTRKTRRKNIPALKFDDCFAKITEFKISNEGKYIEDHDYLASPYKLNNYIHSSLIYCNICRKQHIANIHESHMKMHRFWTCDRHNELKFDNVFMLNQHLAEHLQACKVCGNLVTTNFLNHSANHRVFRPRKKRQRFIIPRIEKVESLCNSEFTVSSPS